MKLKFWDAELLLITMDCFVQSVRMIVVNITVYNVIKYFVSIAKFKKGQSINMHIIKYKQKNNMKELGTLVCPNLTNLWKVLEIVWVMLLIV